MMGVCDYHLGITYYDTDEIAMGEFSFLSSLKRIIKINDKTTIDTTEKIQFDENLETNNLVKEINQFIDKISPGYIQLNQSQLKDYKWFELLDSLNYLGMVWCSRNNNEKAQEYLHLAEQIYTYYEKLELNSSMELNNQDINSNSALPEEFSKFLLVSEKNKKIQDAHTSTIYYLAQVYQYLKSPDKVSL